MMSTKYDFMRILEGRNTDTYVKYIVLLIPSESP